MKGDKDDKFDEVIALLNKRRSERGGRPPRRRGNTTDSKEDHVANPLNLRRELHRDARTNGLVAFDEFGHQTILLRPIPRPNLEGEKHFEPRPWSDADDTALAEHFNAQGFRRVGRDVLRSVIELEARSNPFHPVREYFGRLTWDGQPRLSRFLLDYCDATAYAEVSDDQTRGAAYIEAVTRAFFVSAVARVHSPGCKSDCMLILEGSQGALKSRLLRTVAICEDWFTDSLPHNLESKDAREHLAGRWIVEMSEIAQFRRTEIETVKSYLSCQVDKYRPSYGRSVVSIPRQCVFIGTTNAANYLHDPTGNRRFWPVRVGKIRLAEAERIVEQLWAEAVNAYRSGEAWWLSSPELERLAAREQHGRLELDPWHDQIADYVAAQSTGGEFTTAQIMSHLKVDSGRRDRSHEMRVGNILRALGCERRRSQKKDRGRRYVYCRPEIQAHEDDG
jgi:putative DNA primase/helicase